MKFRKKPMVVEAVQWFPGKEVEGVYSREWNNPSRIPGDSFRCSGHFIDTLEGPLMVSPGDWIITGIKGERYPCKPDIFDATYEPAEGLAP